MFTGFPQAPEGLSNPSLLEKNRHINCDLTESVYSAFTYFVRTQMCPKH